jgi:hypothetical protein
MSKIRTSTESEKLLKIYGKKGKVVSVLNYAICHEDMRSSGGTIPPFFTSALGVSDQFHAPAALPPVPIAQEAGWAPEPVWTLWRTEPRPSGNRTRTVQTVAIQTPKKYGNITNTTC